MSRIIVIARPRTGSTAVMELLGCHPQIQNYGELINPVDKTLPVVEEEIYEYVNEKLSQKPEKVNAPCWPRQRSAFKVHVHQQDEQNFKWDRLIHHCRIETAIVVWRKNILESIVSAKIANQTGEWYSNGMAQEVKTVSLSTDFLEWRINADIQYWTNVFEQWPLEIRPIFVQYEQLFDPNSKQTPADRFQNIFEQIGLEECDYATCYAKRQNPAPLEQKVENWNDLPIELREYKIDIPALFENIISKRFGLPKELITELVPDREPIPSRDGFKYRVAEAFIPIEAVENVHDALRTGHVSSSSMWPKELSEMLKELFEMPVAVPCATGFVSLVLALQSAHIGPNDEVIVPTFTMIAVPNAVLFVGAQPKFADVSENEYNPRWAQIEGVITPKTKAVIISHTYGCPANEIEKIARECKRLGLTLIEDISECVGISAQTEHGPQLLGTFGDYACASMYVNKMLHAGDGGFVMARDPSVNIRLQSMLNHGFTRTFHFVHFEPAINGKMNGLGAAMACGVLENLGYIVEHRQTVAKWYRKFLSTLTPTHLELMPACGVGDTPWVFGLHCKSKQARTELRAWLAKHGIETRDYFFPMHLQPALRNHQDAIVRLPNSEKLASTGFYLPTHPNLTKETVKFITNKIVQFFENTEDSFQKCSGVNNLKRINSVGA